MRYCSVMELLHLRWRAALESDSASVGEARRFAADWLAHAKGTPLVPVEQAGLTGGVLIPKWLARSQNGQHRVIEALGALDVVRSDHHVTEHACVSCVYLAVPADVRSAANGCVVQGLTFDMSGGAKRPSGHPLD